MKSPFPGMDPYIETTDEWPDFHANLIGEIYRDLAPRLPAGFYTRLAKRSYIALAEEEGKEEYWFEPDVKIHESRQGSTPASAAPEQASTAVEDDPVEMRATIEGSFNEMFIDIFERQPERRLITSIEILSPSNKRAGSESRGQYIRKRQAHMMGEANLVEIDLLRGGARMPMRDKWPKSPYTILVSRKEQTIKDRERLTPRCRVWKAYFDRPLPTIPVPLTKPHADVRLDLQPLIGNVYELARYGELIDYSKPLTPPLSKAQVAWLKERLRAGQAPAHKRKASR